MVKRRVHQTVSVPAQPNQEVFQTMTSLVIQEHSGSYQDRTPGKMLRYISWLEKDLLDYPNDTRTLYYLGYSHFDIFLNSKRSQEDWDHLAQGVEYYKERVEFEGNYEERWFSLLKLGEIYERFYNDFETAHYYYQKCSEMDPERADSFFYLGQWYRLRKRGREALPYLETAAALPTPERNLFHWHFLYNCLTKLEYARALDVVPDPSLEELVKARDFLHKADCSSGDSKELSDYKRLSEKMKKMVKEHSSKKKSPHEVTRMVSWFLSKYRDTVFSQVFPEEFNDRLESFQPDLLEAFSQGLELSCKDYQDSTKPFIEFYSQNELEVQIALDEYPKLQKQIEQIYNYVQKVCPL